eukprot:TRINITY_DN4904_c0_g1_i2.p1 TRINITY_DN4904_c0_g1~~TRINITY_DN4904_c0_g1_i2.p1  ORF type:complete len:1242 (-),score=280.98 TRINITY_DN4904_c0_g1_i2:270-3971(-)
MQFVTPNIPAGARMIGAGGSGGMPPPPSHAPTQLMKRRMKMTKSQTFRTHETRQHLLAEKYPRSIPSLVRLCLEHLVSRQTRKKEGKTNIDILPLSIHDNPPPSASSSSSSLSSPQSPTTPPSSATILQRPSPAKDKGKDKMMMEKDDNKGKKDNKKNSKGKGKKNKGEEEDDDEDVKDDGKGGKKSKTNKKKGENNSNEKEKEKQKEKDVAPDAAAEMSPSFFHNMPQNLQEAFQRVSLEEHMRRTIIVSTANLLATEVETKVTEGKKFATERNCSEWDVVLLREQGNQAIAISSDIYEFMYSNGTEIPLDADEEVYHPLFCSYLVHYDSEALKHLHHLVTYMSKFTFPEHTRKSIQKRYPHTYSRYFQLALAYVHWQRGEIALAEKRFLECYEVAIGHYEEGAEDQDDRVTSLRLPVLLLGDLGRMHLQYGGIKESLIYFREIGDLDPRLHSLSLYLCATAIQDHPLETDKEDAEMIWRELIAVTKRIDEVAIDKTAREDLPFDDKFLPMTDPIYAKFMKIQDLTPLLTYYFQHGMLNELENQLGPDKAGKLVDRMVLKEEDNPLNDNHSKVLLSYIQALTADTITARRVWDDIRAPRYNGSFPWSFLLDCFNGTRPPLIPLRWRYRGMLPNPTNLCNWADEFHLPFSAGQVPESLSYLSSSSPPSIPLFRSNDVMSTYTLCLNDMGHNTVIPQQIAEISYQYFDVYEMPRIMMQTDIATVYIVSIDDRTFIYRTLVPPPLQPPSESSSVGQQTSSTSTSSSKSSPTPPPLPIIEQYDLACLIQKRLKQYQKKERGPVQKPAELTEAEKRKQEKRKKKEKKAKKEAKRLANIEKKKKLAAEAAAAANTPGGGVKPKPTAAAKPKKPLPSMVIYDWQLLRGADGPGIAIRGSYNNFMILLFLRPHDINILPIVKPVSQPFCLEQEKVTEGLQKCGIYLYLEDFGDQFRQITNPDMDGAHDIYAGGGTPQILYCEADNYIQTVVVYDGSGIIAAEDDRVEFCQIGTYLYYITKGDQFLRRMNLFSEVRLSPDPSFEFFIDMNEVLPSYANLRVFAMNRSSTSPIGVLGPSSLIVMDEATGEQLHEHRCAGGSLLCRGEYRTLIDAADGIYLFHGPFVFTTLTSSTLRQHGKFHSGLLLDEPWAQEDILEHDSRSGKQSRAATSSSTTRGGFVLACTPHKQYLPTTIMQFREDGKVAGVFTILDGFRKMWLSPANPTHLLVAANSRSLTCLQLL